MPFNEDGRIIICLWFNSWFTSAKVKAPQTHTHFNRIESKSEVHQKQSFVSFVLIILTDELLFGEKNFHCIICISEHIKSFGEERESESRV